QAAPDQFGVRLVRSTDRSYDKSSGNTQASIDYTWVQLTDDAAAKHPKLKSALDKTETDLRKQMAKEFENLKSKAKTSAGKSGRTWSIEQKELPVRADSDVFSTFTVVKEKQGTKSETSLVCSNFDSQTGKGIELADVIDTDDLPGLLAKAYAATYPDDPISGFEEMVDGYSDGDYVWAVSRDGLNFYFANEEDGSVLAVQVLREGNEDSFTGDYADAADSFAVPVGEGAYAFDKLDDGETDLLSVSLGEDESSVTVSMNGKRAVGRFHAYAIEPVLVRTEKEGYYIYVSCSLDNDYQQLAVFDISEDTPVFLGLVQNAGFPKEFDSDTQATMVTLPGNPDEFFLSESMDLLSTYDAARPYSVGDDGMPKALSEWLYPNREIELTVQNGFYADAVDAQTDEIDEEGVKIAKGTELTIFRTDGKSAVDLKAKDGGIFRVDVDASGGWPQTIDGTDIQKLFDGIIFAG
ncbi:MAG: hypothetical protein Q4A32_01085, partial [Lachnospiraceae bacterium]|nr:hypothetical protein [Lachnospiraceae bacterium]